MVLLICRIYEVVDNLKKMLEYFFVGWVVMLLWHLINNLSSLDYTTQQIWCTSEQNL